MRNKTNKLSSFLVKKIVSVHLFYQSLLLSQSLVYLYAFIQARLSSFPIISNCQVIVSESSEILEINIKFYW
ncbi:hypothetical protein BpHYR1_000604 [Brachionus plicatilis]|uniref:Uncharacterized protein n=1 Tax=Brachionus plicatilis TaxID=10195 RepID=A0A3M7R5V1_BRAPC|nr:hypothetical protein BpHYR1_000604 [Brachionus plicatilis]